MNELRDILPGASAMIFLDVLMIIATVKAHVLTRGTWRDSTLAFLGYALIGIAAISFELFLVFGTGHPDYYFIGRSGSRLLRGLLITVITINAAAVVWRYHPRNGHNDDG